MRALLFAIAALCALPVHAQQTRTITDHSGAEVTIPADPQRIVSLHDWSATVMVHELGGNLIGSSGRVDKDGSYYIRSGRELYGLTFDQVAMASVHGMLDMERIAGLDPDLIIGNLGDTQAARDQLSLIAPTVMFDPMNGRPPMDNYRELAGWIGRTERFDTLKADYDAHIAELRGALALEAPSYVAMTPNPESGDLRILRNYGAQTAVLEDLGFRRAPIMDEVPAASQEADFSAEVIGRLDADFIFTTHIEDRGESLESVMADLDAVAPGYRMFLPAVRQGRFISMSRFHVYPTTFAAAGYVMDHLRKLMGAPAR